MVWKDNNPKNGVFEIAPLPQSIEVNYKEPNVDNSHYRKDCYYALESLASVSKGLGIVRLSGAMAISMITNSFPRTHSNMDLAILLQNQPLELFIEQAKSNRMYLFSRTKSWKLNPWGNYKHETFMPLRVEDLVNQTETNLNPMLCAVDSNGNIIPKNDINTRWRLYGYKLKEGLDMLYSVEDETFILPKNFNGSWEYSFSNGGRVKSVSLEFLKKIQEKAMQKSKSPKHVLDYNRINALIK